jgi:GTP-binding protein
LRWKGPVFAISALARDGLKPLVDKIYEHVSAHQRPEPLPDVRFADASAEIAADAPSDASDQRANPSETS